MEAKVLYKKVFGERFVMRVEKVVDFLPGQFMMIYNKVGVKRAYSIASAPNESFLEFFIHKVSNGAVSSYLYAVEEGDVIELEGPYGKFTLEKSESERKVFIGIGTGVAPLRSMILDVLERGLAKEVVLIYGNRFLEEFVYNDEFGRLAESDERFKYYPILSKPDESWSGRKGHVQDVFGEVDFRDADVFVSGNPKIVREIREKIREARKVFVEMF